MSNEYAPDSRQSVDLKWKLRKALEKNVAPRDDGKGLDFGQDVGVDGKLHLNELSDIVGPNGAPLFTDGTQEDVSSKVSSLLSEYYIGKYAGAHFLPSWLAGYDELTNASIIASGAVNFDFCFNSATGGFGEDVYTFDCPDLASDVSLRNGSYRQCFTESFHQNATITLGNFAGNCQGMFFGCHAKRISVRDGKKGLPTSADYLFMGCANLEAVSGFDFTYANTMHECFGQDAKLASIDCTGFRISFDVSATALGHDALVTLINSLETVSSPQTLTMGDDKLALLSDEEKLGATNKGWTLA